MRFLFAQNKPLTCAFEIRKWFKKLESNVRTSLGLFFTIIWDIIVISIWTKLN